MARLQLGGLGSSPATDRVLVVLRAAPEALAAELPPARNVEAIARGNALLVAAFDRRGRMGRFLTRDRLGWFLAGEEVMPRTTVVTRESSPAVGRFALELTVLRDDALELHLAAEVCAAPEGSVFASAREACAYFERFDATRAEDGTTWEPMAPIEVEWRVPGLSAEAAAALTYDSTFRQVRSRRLHARRARFHRVLARAGARPLPAP